MLVTLFFHGLLLAFILIDAPQSAPLVKRATPSYIKAELVTIDKPKAKTASKTTPKPKPVAKPKADDSKAKRLAEQKKRKLEQQKKQQLAKQAEKKKQLAALEKQRLEDEQKRLEEQQRIQRESAQELEDAIAQENAQSQAADDQELANSYTALITGVIQNNWNRPPSARNGMETELALQLVPTGEVVSVRVVRSSGNAAFDRSAENAVLKAERFPELQQLPPRVFEQYFRRLRLKFRPEDLRL